MSWKEAEDEAKLDRFLDEPERERDLPSPEDAVPPTPREVEAARRSLAEADDGRRPPGSARE